MNDCSDLVPGLPARELHEKLWFHHRRGEVSERALGFYLLDMQRRGEFRPGFHSAAHWAREHLGCRRPDRLILLAKRLEDLPALDGAFDRGEISWSKVREIARVATPATEEEWITLARRKTSRELEAAVRGAKPGDPPGNGLRTPRVKSCVRIPLAPDEKMLWEAAVRKVRAELGRGATPRDAAVAMAELALRTDPGSAASGSPVSGSTVPPCVVVVHRSADRRSSWIETEDGPVAIAPEVTEEKIRRGARVIDVRDVEKRGSAEGPEECAAVRFGERGRVAEEDRDETVSADLKAAVIARDSQRCVICRSREHLTAHHLDSRAHGGRSTMERLVTLCGACHSAVHEGALVLRVDDAGRVTGRDRDGKVIGEVQSAREVLEEAGSECPLEVIAPRDSVAGTVVPAVEPGAAVARSLDELPRELTAGEWRALEQRLEWSPAHHAFVFRPEAELKLPAAPSEPAVATAPPCTEGSGTRPAARPESFTEFTGQERAVGNLLLAARAAGERGEVLGHVLLSGEPGLGKTTLARLLAGECGVGLEEIVAGHLGDPHQLISLLVRLEKGELLFLDEIHRLKPALEETLYTALEDGFMDVVVREGGRTRRIRVHLEPFTLVGATTRLGMVSEPLRGRFPNQERLERYSRAELARVVSRAAGKLGVPVSAEAAREVACRSRGTPREAIRLLERARDVAQVSAGASTGVAHVGHGIELAHVGQAAERLGIDAQGLGLEERRIVELLVRLGRPVGVESLASRVGLDLETLREVHEPRLERAGLVERTERGRVATPRAQELYGRGTPARGGIPILRMSDLPRRALG